MLGLEALRLPNMLASEAMSAYYKSSNTTPFFRKEYVESALKDAPGGVHIVLEGTTKGEVPLVGLPL